MSLAIEVVSDVVCPWCFIGKRRLEGALALYAAAHPAAPRPRVTWRPFQLNPGMPLQGMARREYIARKFGGDGAAVYGRVGAVGREVGISFAFDRITRQPNTLAAHTLIELADRRGQQDAAVEALFRAYFLDGVDLTRRDNLVDIGRAAGLEETEIESLLDDPRARSAAEAEDASAREAGIAGVPCFIFNRRLALSGAQPAEALFEAMQHAAAAPAVT